MGSYKQESEKISSNQIVIQLIREGANQLTSEDKIKIITQVTFLRSLSTLKTRLDSEEYHELLSQAYGIIAPIYAVIQMDLFSEKSNPSDTSFTSSQEPSTESSDEDEENANSLAATNPYAANFSWS